MESHGVSSTAAPRCSPLTESTVPPEDAQFCGITELEIGESNEKRAIAVLHASCTNICELVPASGDAISLSV